jgi:hypothetical protein
MDGEWWIGLLASMIIAGLAVLVAWGFVGLVEAHDFSPISALIGAMLGSTVGSLMMRAF